MKSLTTNLCWMWLGLALLSRSALAQAVDARAVERRSDAPALVYGAPPAGTIATQVNYPSSGAVPIPDPPATATSTIVVSGAGPEIWDVDVLTFIRHDWSSDLVISVTSPAGTTVKLSSQRGVNYFDPGEYAPNVFNGTLWDDHADQVTHLVTDYHYDYYETATPLVPEGALGVFRGEDPNGTWTLTVADVYLCCDFGTLDGWAVRITTLNSALSPSAVGDSNVNPVAVPDNSSSGATSQIAISNGGSTICDVNVTAVITHTSCNNLDITLHSPAGTVVTLSSDNGGTHDNVFNGTTWDDSATGFTSTLGYANNVAMPLLIPEGALSKFQGEDPNGDWTLKVVDDQSGNVGTLEYWRIDITTCALSEPGEAYCFGDGLDPVVTAQCPCTNFGDPGHGCANSGFASGALLTATGFLSPNTIVFTVTNVPNNTLATGFRNISNTNPGGVVFGDGVRCQSGTLIRFSAHNTGSLGDAPNTWSSPTDTITPGLTRYYQVQYRNPAPAFCPPATFNISNGYRIDW